VPNAQAVTGAKTRAPGLRKRSSHALYNIYARDVRHSGRGDTCSQKGCDCESTKSRKGITEVKAGDRSRL
jgi:hypothetical protein